MKKFKAMMKKLFSSKATTRVLSAFLSAVLLFYVIPTVVYGEVAGLFESEPSEESSSGTSYEYINEMHEVESLREESVKHFRLEDGSYVAAQYNYPVHYADEDGKWQDIDNTLESAIGGVYATSNARIKLAKKITGNETLFTLKDGNTKLSFGLIGAAKGTVGTVINGEDSSSDTELQKMMNLEKLSSSVIYENILPGVDLEYVIDSLNIKENLIVKEKGDSYSYSFSMKLNGMYAELDEDGNVLIYNDDSGEIEYTIPAPVVFDSASAHAPKGVAIYTLEADGKKYTLTVTVDAAWMNSKDRVYPVTVDPTVSKSSSKTVDTFIDGDYRYRDLSYGNSTYLYLYPTSTVYWKTNALLDLPTGAYISSAKVKTKSPSSSGAYAAVYEVLDDWDTTLTWNEYTYGSIPTGTLGELLDYNMIEGGTYYWDITSLARDWYKNELDSTTGKPNYGVAFQLLFGYTVPASIYSNEFSSADSKPTIEISYTVMKGAENYWAASSHSVGMAGNGSINLATGRLTFAIPTISTTDSLIPYTPTLIYDSALANSFYYDETAQCAFDTPYMGYGFKLNTDESIVKKSYVNANGITLYYFVYSDADGTEHAFYLNPDDNTTFIDEDGLGMYLILYDNGEISIINDSKITRSFTKMDTTPNDAVGGWYLNRITDKAGNSVVFHRDEEFKPTKVSIQPFGIPEIEFLDFVYNQSGALAMVLNQTAKEAVVLRYSSVYNGNIETNSLGYLRKIERVYSTYEVSYEDWVSYAISASINSSIRTKATSEYNYDPSGRLSAVIDNLINQKIRYDWTGDSITQIRQIANSSLGNMLDFRYGNNYTEITDVGSDEIHLTDDDIITHYTFDQFGRAISVYSSSKDKTTIYGGSVNSYSTESTVKNKIESNTVLGGESVNYLANGNFKSNLNETNLLEYWLYGENVIARTATENNESCSVVDLFAQRGGTTYLKQYVKLSSGTYTLSVPKYKTLNAENCTLEIVVTTLSGQLIKSEKMITGSDNSENALSFSMMFDITTNDTAVEVKIVFTANENADSEVSHRASVYSVMLDKNTGASEMTLINGGAFDETVLTANGTESVSVSQFWESNTSMIIIEDPTDTINRYFNKSLYLTSDADTSQYAKQRIFSVDRNELSASLNNNFGIYIVSGFAKSLAAVRSENAIFRLRADVYYYQGEGVDDVVRSHYFDFSPDVTGWQFTGGSFDLEYVPENYDPNIYTCVSAIDIVCEYSYQPDSFALFDNIYVYKDTSGNTTRYTYYKWGDTAGLPKTISNGIITEYFVYDDMRKVTCHATSQGKMTEYFYNGSSFDSGLLAAKIESNFDYNGTKVFPIDLPDPAYQVALSNMVETDYYYDNFGLCTRSETYALFDYFTIKEDVPKIIYTATYNTAYESKIFGSLAFEDNEMDVCSSYYYDESNGWLLAELNHKTATGYFYNYNAYGALLSVYPATYVPSEGYVAVTDEENVQYGYNNLRLNSIDTPTTRYTIDYDEFGNATVYSVSDNALIEYTYMSNNGKVSKTELGNGLVENYYYNELEKISKICYSITDPENNTTETFDAYTYEYTANGLIHKITDLINGKVTMYKYDTLNRLIGVVTASVDDMHQDFSGYVTYNDEGKLHNSTWMVQFNDALSFGQSNTLYYTYDGKLSSADQNVAGNLAEESFEYDDYGRILRNQYVANGFTRIVDYDYLALGVGVEYATDPGYTGAFVSKFTSTVNGNSTAYDYTYDGHYNISTVAVGNLGSIRYYYDDLDQLLREDNELLGKTYVYTYDYSGNITSKKTYALTAANVAPVNLISTQSYSYTDDWGDLLTAYNGVALTYDEIGNPLTYYNGASYTFEWLGRRLVSATKGTDSLSFTYNADGIRTSKTKNGVTTEYYLNGSNIVAEKTNGNMTLYVYGADGSVIGMMYHGASYSENQWDVFWFEKNMQGDIVAVYNESGTKLVSYTYDAWGNFTRTYTNGGQNTAAANNPFTYRGYYYDYDLGLYYLNSRYYDSAVGRFINSDSLIAGNSGSIHGHNLFVYCFNNPISLTDSEGNWPTWDEFKQGTVNITNQIASATKKTISWIDDNVLDPVVNYIVDNTTITHDVTPLYTSSSNRGQLKHELFPKDKHSSNVGNIRKVSALNANASILVGNDNVSFGLKGVGDVLTATSDIGLTSDHNGIGVRAGAKGSLASGRITFVANIYDYQIEFGGYADLASIGVSMSYYSSQGFKLSNSSGWISGGLIFRVNQR